MEIHKAMEAHVAWKVQFAPYLAQQDGSLCAVAVKFDDSTNGSGAAAIPGQIVALPMVTTVNDRRAHVKTSTTAVLIQPEILPGSRMPFSVRPLSADEPSAAIRSITRLVGRFTS